MSTLRVVLLIVALSSFGSCLDAQVYHPDSAHLWNRLHRALFVRTARDGVELGLDVLEPLLVNNSTHLLEGESHAELLSVLGEFNESAGSQRLGSPLQRAVLQHDLWAIFDWVSARNEGMQWVGYERASPQRKELQKSLAKAISKLALSTKEIESLPSNYANALASRKYATVYDLAAGATPFLPRDLLAPESTWVELAEPIAPIHTFDFGGRSFFRVFVCLPGGRQSTIEFLAKLRKVNRHDIVDVGLIPFEELDVQLPTFPPLTQFALVRQMAVIDNANEIRPTKITQSVQLRVLHDRKASPSDTTGADAFYRKMLRRASQDFYEFNLRRRTLFAGKHGGLHASDIDTKTIISPLRRHSVEPDPIANRTGAEIMAKSPVNLRQCVLCHREPNVYSFESFVQSNSLLRRPIPLFPKSENLVGDSALDWKRSQFSWGLYLGLVDDE